MSPTLGGELLHGAACVSLGAGLAFACTGHPLPFACAMVVALVQAVLSRYLRVGRIT